METFQYLLIGWFGVLFFFGGVELLGMVADWWSTR